MTHAARLARDEAITDALRVAAEAIKDEQLGDQAARIIEALKRLRSGRLVRVATLDRVDYLERVQRAARAAWLDEYNGALGLTEADNTTAGVDTPIGRLRIVTWQRRWTGSRGERTAWASEYYLNEEPIAIAEIRAAGLAQRPTTRKRRKKN